MTKKQLQFRAWDKEKKQYFYHNNNFDERMVLQLNGVLGLFNGKTYDTVTDRFVLEQYTGLKDKDGKKIFEGDILEMTNVGWKYTLVKFYLGIFAFYTEETSFLYPMVRCYWEEGRVIGNIHDNPELLK